MPATLPRHLIITGTGRAGTTFLVELLTALGLDTGFQGKRREDAYFEHCQAGLEQEDIEAPGTPYVVKNPGLSLTLDTVLARGRIQLDHVLVPIRRLEDAAASRIRVGGTGDVPGGLVGTENPADQAAVLSAQFHHLMLTLARYEVPYTLLEFPRFARDPDYTFRCLRPVLGDCTEERFRQAFALTARPEKVHAFSSKAPVSDGKPAEAFARTLAQKRRRKRLRRLLWAVSAVAAFVGWSVLRA